MVAATDPVDAAAHVGLVHVCDEEPGYVRRRRGRGFSYHRADGSPATAREKERIKALMIPPAWTDVWICADDKGHLQATGRDDKDRKQYLYHDLWREVRDEDKFAGLATFGRRLPTLRTKVDVDLGLRGWPIERTCALAVRLLDLTLLRIGGVQYAADNESYGLTTLLSEHATLGRGAVELCFPGKSGVEQTVRVADATSRKLLKDCLELGGERVLSHQSEAGVAALRAEDVNEYLKDRGGPEITAKDFRTWGASVLVTEVLGPLPPPDDEKVAATAMAEAEKLASEVLGNTVAVARSAYIHPGLGDSHASGDLHDHWRRSRSGPRLSRAERCLLKFLA